MMKCINRSLSSLQMNDHTHCIRTRYGQWLLFRFQTWIALRTKVGIQLSIFMTPCAFPSIKPWLLCSLLSSTLIDV